MFPPNIDITKIPCNEWSDAFYDFYKSVYNTFSSEPVRWQYVKKRELYSMHIPLDEPYIKKFTRFLKKSKNIDSMRLEDVYVDPDIESIFTELQYNGIRLVRTAEKRTGAPEAARDILMEEERAGQDTNTRRVERLNAAYERDRAVLAKTDPAFAHGTFRDVGHAEGSDEPDGNEIRSMASKMTETKKEQIKDLKRLYDE